jgi:cytidine deaminase
MQTVFEGHLKDLATFDQNFASVEQHWQDALSLVGEARLAQSRSYAPYSHFNVGAAGYFTAVSGQSHMFTGANQENAAYSPTFCAECVAITAARHKRFHTLKMMAVCGGPDSTVDAAVRKAASEAWVAPCGRCRQVMAETAADNCLVVLVRGDDRVMGVLFSELFPMSFGPKNLGVNPADYRV